jgi:NAD(P)-dependent dehydrogenase (short-subunit alcohol dehydrogenase family)
MGMMTELFAARLAREGINVYEIRPGIIDTDMARNAKSKYDALIEGGGLLPIARWGQPEDVAKAVGAIVDGALPYSTGAVIDVDGGYRIRRL